jgi:hypothetical protein
MDVHIILMNRGGYTLANGIKNVFMYIEILPKIRNPSRRSRALNGDRGNPCEEFFPGRSGFAITMFSRKNNTRCDSGNLRTSETVCGLNYNSVMCHSAE